MRYIFIHWAGIDRNVGYHTPEGVIYPDYDVYGRRVVDLADYRSHDVYCPDGSKGVVLVPVTRPEPYEIILMMPTAREKAWGNLKLPARMTEKVKPNDRKPAARKR